MPKSPAGQKTMSVKDKEEALERLVTKLREHRGKLLTTEDGAGEEIVLLLGKLVPETFGKDSLYTYSCCGTIRSRPKARRLQNGHSQPPKSLKAFVEPALRTSARIAGLRLLGALGCT